MQDNQDNIYNQTPKKRTKEEFIEAMTREYIEISSINENLKELKEQAKDQGFDAALLAKVAKAVSDAKVSEAIEKAEAFIQMAEKVENSKYQ